MNVYERNRTAWNKQSHDGSRWCIPVDDATIAAARGGEWQVILTPNLAVPRRWFGSLAGQRILCLASGGGQQAPTLAAVGAIVVSFDASDEQLQKDRAVAERHRLPLQCEQGDMADLTRFTNGQFDLVFHPVSNCFVPDVQVVWNECFRVLRTGGALLAGFMNPAFYLFDHERAERGEPLTVVFAQPYSDLQAKDADAQQRVIEAGDALQFGHSLQAQIGGQLAAGFHITDLYEDYFDDAATPLNRYMPTSIATRAIKPCAGGPQTA